MGKFNDKVASIAVEIKSSETLYKDFMNIMDDDVLAKSVMDWLTGVCVYLLIKGEDYKEWLVSLKEILDEILAEQNKAVN